MVYNHFNNFKAATDIKDKRRTMIKLTISYHPRLLTGIYIKIAITVTET